MAEGKSDRRQALDLAIAQIERQFGKGAVMRLGAGGPLEEIAVIPTGALSLDAERGIEAERARGNDGDLLERAAGTEPHDSALPELPLDLGDREVESLSPVALAFRHRVLPSENVLRAF